MKKHQTTPMSVQGKDLTPSLSQCPITSPSTTMLSQSEFESLMQETAHASQVMKAQLAKRKAKPQDGTPQPTKLPRDTRLSPAEIESLRNEAKQAREVMRAELAARKAKRQDEGGKT